MVDEEQEQAAERRRAERFRQSVETKANKKIEARAGRKESVWNWLGMMGLVGWSVAVPALIGVAVGRWIDQRWPSDISWTLTLLLVGIALGCLTAWRWVTRESRRD